MNILIKALLRIGFVSRKHCGAIAWPFHFPPRHAFSSWKELKDYMRFWNDGSWKPYMFRNRPGVIKWVPGRMLPRRWGIGWCGFEFGDRGH